MFEGLDLGVDLLAELVDRHEEGELAVAEGVEDLPVVVADEHRAAVGDQPEAREVAFARVAQGSHGGSHPGGREPGVEQRPHHPQRHEITELVASGAKVAVNGRFAGRLNTGKTVELRFADFFTLDDEGLFTVRDTFFFTPLV